ncbi:Uncharacterized protein NEOC65_000223 [Neochlamydia sp. AcF65]|uniref:hypothetical protein n=1 Tax=Neochlamydia sp. AcF65 TaxID=2795735 RepID=UPI001BCA057F|nr:hypothetical protein [Neochlamydia sp. AcF65]MBS4165174.1 Uncharacterized protein [Neochlamydia sp. AcF65]
MVSPVSNNSQQDPSTENISAADPGLKANSNASPSVSSPSSTQVSGDTLASRALADPGLVIFNPDNPQIPKPSLLSYLQVISLATRMNKQSSYDESALINLLRSNFYKNSIDNANNLLQILNELLALQAETQKFNQAANDGINSVNIPISDYNSGVSQDNSSTTSIHNAAINFNNAYTLYQAQTQAFLAGNISAEEYAQNTATYNAAQAAYNQAVNTYNNYVTSRNQTINAYNDAVNAYNNQATANNQKLAEINEKRARYGLEPLPPQELLSTYAPLLPVASSAPPAPVDVPAVINASPIPLLTPYPTATPTDLIESIYLPLFQLTFAIVGQINKGLKLNLDMRDFLDYYLPVKTSLMGLPASFASQMMTNNNSAAGNSNTAGLASIAASLEPSIVARLHNQGNQNAYYQKFSAVLKSGTIDVSLVATANILASASLVSGQQMIDLLKNDAAGRTIDGVNISKALALGFISNVTHLIAQNSLSSALQDLNDNPAASQALNTLSALINLSSAGVALSLLSSSLGQSGLGAQLLGLTGLSSSTIASLTGQGVGINDFASNPFVQAYAAQQLSTQIANALGLQAGLPSSGVGALQQMLQNAVLASFQQTSSVAASNQFFNNLAQNLTKNGITGQQAADALSAASTAFYDPLFTSQVDFRDGLKKSLESQGFSSNDALQIASSIAGVAPTATSDPFFTPNDLDTNRFISNLASNLTLAGISTPSEIANKVASALLANTEQISQATLRDHLQYQLGLQGLAKDEARRVATGISFSATLENNPLSQANLHQELLSSITAVYLPVLGLKKAQEQAQQLADLLVGPANANAKDIHDAAQPYSLVRSIADHLDSIKKTENEALFEATVESFKDYIKPSLDLYTFTQRLMDPANKLVYANDLMLAPAVNTGTIKMGGTNPALEVAV